MPPRWPTKIVVTRAWRWGSLGILRVGAISALNVKRRAEDAIVSRGDFSRSAHGRMRRHALRRRGGGEGALRPAGRARRERLARRRRRPPALRLPDAGP